MSEQQEAKRGRPRLDDALALRSSVTVSLPERVHDAIIVRARIQRVSVAELLRTLILSSDLAGPERSA